MDPEKAMAVSYWPLMSSGRGVLQWELIWPLLDVKNPQDLSCAFSHTPAILSLEQQRKCFPDKDTMAQIGHFLVAATWRLTGECEPRCLQPGDGEPSPSVSLLKSWLFLSGAEAEIGTGIQQ